MINKKIAMSALSIVTALSLMGGATYAFFSDSGTSSNNVFASGTLDLQLSNDNVTYSNSVTGSFGQTNMIPGGTPVSGDLFLKNTGSVNSSDIDITFSNAHTQALTGAGTVHTEDMDKYLKIEVLTYDGVDLLSGLVNSNGNGFKDLDDLEAQGLPNLSGLTAGDDKPLVMDIRLDISAPNEMQGDSVTTTINVTMNQ